MSASNRVNFGSKIGLILAAAGSAVGLGNIWRFPSVTGENGGAAFLLIYLFFTLLLGIPVMVSEFLIGRRSRANTATTYKKLAPNTHWRWVGLMSVFAAFLILSYYSVVAGWTLDYAMQAVSNRFSESSDYKAFFDDFVSNPYMPCIWLVAFMCMTHLVVVRGVKDGIELFSKWMMPLLFIIILVLMCCSLSMPGAKEGLRFFLMPDFSKVNSQVVLSAMGQAFFSLSLGMGCLCTYASYFKPETSLVKTAFSVAAIDTFIAIVSGLIIFPAVFSVSGLAPDAGAGLVFITLPNVFQTAFAGAPWLAYIFSTMFYCLLVLAALTSTISMHEVATAYLHEAFKFSRRKAARIVSLVCIALGILCSLSFGVLKEFTFGGLTLFNLFDFVTAKLLLPLGGMFICIFTGWYLNRNLVLDEITNGGLLRVRSFKIYIVIIRYIAPVAIGIVFIYELFFKS